MQGWGLLTLGSLMFIPGEIAMHHAGSLSEQIEGSLLIVARLRCAGAYVTSIAFLTFRGYEGYSYSQIPY